MTDRNDIIQLCAAMMSTLLLCSGLSSFAVSTILILLAIPMIRRPETCVTLLFVSSWYSKMVILPSVSAFYFYFLLFIMAVAMRKIHVLPFRRGTMKIVMLLLCAWILLSLGFALVPEYMATIKVISSVIVVMIAYSVKLNNIGYLNLALCCVSVVASVFFLCRMTFAPLLYMKDTGNIFLPTIMEGMNPNAGCQVILVITIIIFTYSFKISRFYLLLFPFLNFYTTLSLGSRTSFYALVASLALYLFFFWQQKWRYKLPFLLAMFLVALAVFYFYILNPHSASRLALSTIAEDGGSGRFNTWLALQHDVIPNYWFKGIGIGRANYGSLGYIYDADNYYIDLVCQLGVIGFVLCLYVHVVSTVLSLKCRRQMPFLDTYFILLVAFFVVGIGESVFDNQIFWMTMALAAFHITSCSDIALYRTTDGRIIPLRIRK